MFTGKVGCCFVDETDWTKLLVLAYLSFAPMGWCLGKIDPCHHQLDRLSYFLLCLQHQHLFNNNCFSRSGIQLVWICSEFSGCYIDWFKSQLTMHLCVFLVLAEFSSFLPSCIEMSRTFFYLPNSSLNNVYLENNNSL